MKKDSYQRLSEALDGLPGRFPGTTSGVEIRLLKKAFTEPEAELASHMTRKYETADAIALRAGIDLKETKRILRVLIPKELVKERSVNGVRQFRLGPFLVGWYEAMMEGDLRNDLEYARLFEQYMLEGGGEKIMSPRPGVLGVVPVRGSLKKELLQPYDDIDAHFARHERFKVSDCVCRMERNLLGSKCTHTVKRCGFMGLPPQTPLSENVLNREQALKLFIQLEEEGHVHTGFYGFIAGAESPQFVGCCNCCGDCCGVLRAINEWGASAGPQKSNYRAVYNQENCTACGVCIERCHVHAVKEGEDGKPVFDRKRCIGCGLCVVKCPTDSVELAPVSREEWFDVPSSFEDWEERRLQQMKEKK
jgi:Pyruvate/2-oxoacid:ferredoxin oxidoreductase delta subunit